MGRQVCLTIPKNSQKAFGRLPGLHKVLAESPQAYGMMMNHTLKLVQPCLASGIIISNGAVNFRPVRVHLGV